jgi:uncharacterized lipoprotein YddW (UPF0748 family)
MNRLVNLLIPFLLIWIIIPCAESDSIRGVQVFSLESRDIPSLKSEIEHLKLSGFNTLIIRVFKNPGDSRYHFLPEAHSAGVHFASSTEPVVSDVLAPVLEAAHDLNMKVFAWITTRKSRWILSGNPDWDSPVIEPETMRVSPGGHLDVFRTDVEKRLLGMLSDLAGTGVDGILLQDDLVSRQFEDFFTDPWRKFKGRPFQSNDLFSLFNLGRKPFRYRAAYHDWARHKSRSLATVLRRMVRHLKKINPSLEIAVNLYYETAVAPHHGRLWLSQDLEDLATIPADYWAIMAYQHQMAQELNLSLEQVALKLKQADQNLRNSLLIPESKIIWKFQTQDWRTGTLTTREDWQRIVRVFLPGQYILAPYRNSASIRSFSSAVSSAE